MLSKEEILKICKEIFKKYEVLTEEEDIFSIEQKMGSLDSLTNVTLLIDIEEKFNITLPDEYLIDPWSNFKSLIGLIQEMTLEE